MVKTAEFSIQHMLAAHLKHDLQARGRRRAILMYKERRTAHIVCWLSKSHAGLTQPQAHSEPQTAHNSPLLQLLSNVGVAELHPDDDIPSFLP
jgi:hypothetical protein